MIVELCRLISSQSKHAEFIRLLSSLAPLAKNINGQVKQWLQQVRSEDKLIYNQHRIQVPVE
jgi:hypothetical protein